MAPLPAAPASPPTGIRLIEGLRFVPQRGSNDWHCVIESPEQKKFFRIGRREYLIVSAIQGAGQSGLASIVERLHLTNPDLEIDAATIDQTLRWLVGSGLAKVGADPEKPQNGAASPAATTAIAPIDPFMFRIPIVSGPTLESWVKRFGFLCSMPFVILTLALMAVGLGCLAIDTKRFMQLSADLFVPSAALWWVAAWLLLKAIHEFGHAVVCIRHGGQLRGAGIASFYFAPVPYVDTTEMWRLPERRSRAYCAAAGMWLELVAASIAILVCQLTENTSVQYLCASIATLGTFTTLAFNANPLVRFDGYYILSDALNRPNLWTEGQTALKAFASDPSKNWSSTLSNFGLPLIGYGLACFVSRILMLVCLAWGTWAAYRGVGLVCIGLASYLWFIGPMLRKRAAARGRAAMAANGPTPSHQPAWLHRGKRWFIGWSGLAAAIAFSILTPSPWQPLSPGFVSCGDSRTLRAQSDGIVAEVLVDDGQTIEAGTVIGRIENPSLSLEGQRLQKTCELAEERCLVLRAQGKMPELQAAQARLDATQQQLAQVEQQLSQLVLTAPVSGRVMARSLSDSIGKLVKVGQPLCEILASEAIEVRCSIAQSDIEAYRHNVGRSSKIYLTGSRAILGTLHDVQPRCSESLNNPALAAKFDGPIAVRMSAATSDSENTLKAESPRFEATITIDAPSESTALTPGQLCRVELIERRVSIAEVLQRWKNAFIEWIRPVESHV